MYPDKSATEIELERHLRATQHKLARVNRFVCWFAAAFVGFAIATTAFWANEVDDAERHANWEHRRADYFQRRELELMREVDDALVGWDQAEWLRAACEEALDWKVAR